jgi:hypothetical protein
MRQSVGLRRAAVVALVLGCVSAAQAASPVDGAYVGTSKVTVGRDFGVCGKDFRMTANVVDGSFDYVWDRRDNIVVPIRIATDGTVTGSGFRSKGAGAGASGRLSGKSLEIDLKGKECARHLSLKRTG